MNISEKIELCSKCFIAWKSAELQKQDMTKHDKEIADIFIAKALREKFNAFKIDICLPDILILMLDLMTDSNPGQSQIILKELLNDIVKHNGLIKPGYIITSDDFAHCFPSSFPITEIPKINDKYRKLWDAQKKECKGIFDTDNQCDTPEWWLEVMGG